MNEQTQSDTSVEKNYSKVDLLFLEQCVAYCDASKIPYSKMARFLSLLMGKTHGGIKEKMQQIKKNGETGTKVSADDDNANEHITKMPESTPFETTKYRVSQFTASPARNIELNHEDNDKVAPFTINDVGKIVTVTVQKVKPFGAFCKSDDGKTGLVIKSHISDHFVTSVSDYLMPGDTFKALVIEDKEKPGKTLLSARAVGNIIAINQRE